MNHHELSVWSSYMQAQRLGLSRCPSATAVVILPVWTVCWPETLTVPGTPQLNGALDHLRMQKGKTLTHKHNRKIAIPHVVPNLHEFPFPGNTPTHRYFEECSHCSFSYNKSIYWLSNSKEHKKEKHLKSVSYTKSSEFPFTVTNIVKLYIY